MTNMPTVVASTNAYIRRVDWLMPDTKNGLLDVVIVCQNCWGKRVVGGCDGSGTQHPPAMLLQFINFATDNVTRRLID